MIAIPEQSFTFFVVGIGALGECYLPVDDQSDPDSIKEQMVEAGVTAAGYGTILAKNPNGDIAKACLNRDGTIRWELLAEAIRKAEKGTNIDALVAYLEDTSEVTLDNFDDEYMGCFDSAADHAEAASTASGDTARGPEHLRPYIDWTRVAQEAERAGAIWTRETADGVHVFRG